MPILDNPRHERFAQSLAAGKSSTEAYVEAGYKDNRHNAAALAREEHISTRVQEILARGADRAEIDIARTLKELVRLGTSDIRNAFTESGHLKDPHSWSDDFAASVASIEVVTRNVGKDADGNTEVEHIHKIKVWDKNSALEKIAKHLGMFIERSEVGRPGEFDGLTVEQKRERVVGIAKQLGIDRIGDTVGSA